MRMLASPLFALGFGTFLALAETRRRWGSWPFLPFLLDDWIAGLLLVYGASPALSSPHGRRRADGGSEAATLGDDMAIAVRGV